MKKSLSLFLLLSLFAAMFAVSASAEDNFIEDNVTFVDQSGRKTKVQMRFNILPFGNGMVEIKGIGADGVIYNSLLTDRDYTGGEIIVPEKVGPANEYTVYSVGTYAFSYCPAKVTLPQSVKVIDYWSFYEYAYEGYDFQLPINVTNIGENAFESAKIKGITLNANLKGIDDCAFDRSSIESLIIPKSVFVIGKGITSHCNNLKVLRVEDGNETYYSPTYSNVIMRDRTLEMTSEELSCFRKSPAYHPAIDVVIKIVHDWKIVKAGCPTSRIPSEADRIEKWAFNGINFLNQDVSLSANMWLIEKQAFSKTNIKNLSFLSNKVLIHDEAFQGCKSMESLKFYGNATVKSGAFKDCTALEEMWCFTHKPDIQPIENQFENVGPDWTPFNGKCKIMAAYPDEFTDTDGDENVWKRWFASQIYPTSYDPHKISTIYLDDYTWPVAGEDADFTATSLTDHATVSSVAYRVYNNGWQEIDPSPCALNGKFDIGFTITLDEGYTFGDNPALFVGGDQNDVYVRRSDTEMVFIIKDYKVPTPPGGVPIKSVSVSVTEPVEGQPLSTKVTWPTGMAAIRQNWSVSNVEWTGDDPDIEDLGNYDLNKSYTLTVTVEADENYCFTEDVKATLNDMPAVAKRGFTPEGVPTLTFSVEYGKNKPKMYTVFDGDQTLTYYYGDAYDKSNPYLEFYDPVNNPYAVRFAGYAGRVTQIVIDPSMKDAPLTSTEGMFFGYQDTETQDWYYLSGAKGIQGLENLNTADVTDMSNMFRSLNSLESLDVSSFNTENVVYMSKMFYGCKSLTALDITNFNTDKVTSAYRMFACCQSLTTIYCNGDWTDKSGSEMFDECPKLAGGKGTEYDENYTDQTYARPDGGEDKPGYFTGTAPTPINYIGLELTPRMSELNPGDEMPHNFLSTSWGTNLNIANFKVGTLQWYYADKPNEEGDGLMAVPDGEGYDPATHYALMTTFRADEDCVFADDINVTILFEDNDQKNPIFSNRYTDSENRSVLLVMFDCPAKRVKGDVNGDRDVNTADVVAVYAFIEKGEASGFTHEACDVNGDDSVDTADVVAIYAAIIGEEAGSRAFCKQMSRLMSK